MAARSSAVGSIDASKATVPSPTHTSAHSVHSGCGRANQMQAVATTTG